MATQLCCPPSLQDLPDLVMMNIFSYLDLQDLCKIGGVCRRWYQISRSKRLWQYLRVKNTNYYNIIKLFPYLSSDTMYIKLGKNPENVFIPLSLPQVFIELSKHCPSLKILIVDNTTLSYCENCLLSFFHRLLTNPESAFSELEGIELEGSEHEAIELAAELEADLKDKNCPKDFYLTMESIRSVSSFDEINKYPTLKHLKVLSVRRSWFDTVHFFCKVDDSVLPQLEVLDLTGSSCMFYYFPITLSRLSNLQELYLGGSKIQNGPLQQMKSWLKQIKVLDLEGLEIHERNFVLFDILKDSKCLEKLYVGHSDLVNDEFLNCLKRNVFPHLTVLCLRYTSVSLGGVKELVKSWSSLKLITAFDKRFPVRRDRFCDHFLENHCNYD